MPIDQCLDGRQKHPIAHNRWIMIGIGRQHRLLNFCGTFAKHLGFAFEDTRLSHSRRRDSLRDTWQAVPAAHRIHQGGSELIDVWHGRAGRSITAERGLIGTRLTDVGIGMMRGRHRDGAEQIHHAGVTASCRRFEKGYVGGQPDVGRNPTAREIGNEKSRGAVVPKPGSPRHTRLLPGHRVDEPLQPLLLGCPAGYRPGGRPSCRRCCGCASHRRRTRSGLTRSSPGGRPFYRRNKRSTGGGRRAWRRRNRRARNRTGRTRRHGWWSYDWRA